MGEIDTPRKEKKEGKKEIKERMMYSPKEKEASERKRSRILSDMVVVKKV